MHVHIHCERGEVKFWLEPGIELAQSFGLATRQIRAAKTLIEEHYDEIRNAWQDRFGSGGHKHQPKAYPKRNTFSVLI